MTGSDSGAEMIEDLQAFLAMVAVPLAFITAGVLIGMFMLLIISAMAVRLFVERD